MKRVTIESPYAGDLKTNIRYARALLLDSLQRGEAPFLSHLLYTQVLDDKDPHHRETGIAAGLEWGPVAHTVVVGVDLGVSAGMRRAIEKATREGMEIMYRTLGNEWRDAECAAKCVMCGGDL